MTQVSDVLQACSSGIDLQNIMFKHGAIDIVVRWISIDELVQKQSIEWHSPVQRTRKVGVILPGAVVVCDIDCGLVLVEVVVKVLLVES